MQRLQTIHNIYKFRDTYVFIKGEEKKDIEFLPPFPYQFIEPDTFTAYQLAPYLPLIALVDEHGIYRKIWITSNFNLNRVIPLLRQEGILEK